MSDNMKLWQAVEKTPVEHTKAITGKSYKGTSPKPHYLVQKATEIFGPCGIGWGFSVEERVEQGAMIGANEFDRMHIAKVKVWYKWEGERGEVEHIGGTPFSGRRSSGSPFTDEDAPKKSVTDALIKALSMIGFAGDIFMGRYDDSKYVSDLQDEAKEKAKSSAALKRDDAWTKALADIEQDMLDVGSVVALEALQKSYWDRANKEGWTQAWKDSLNDVFIGHRNALHEANLWGELEAIQTLQGLKSFWEDNSADIKVLGPNALKRFNAKKDEKKAMFDARTSTLNAG